MFVHRVAADTSVIFNLLFDFIAIMDSISNRNIRERGAQNLISSTSESAVFTLLFYYARIFIGLSIGY